MSADAAVFLRGPRYVLGEFEVHHTAIANLPARAEELRMVPDAALWGWGTVHRSERSLAELAAETGAATLRAAGIEPGSVDALVLCSTEVPGTSGEHGRFVRDVLGGIGLGDVAFFGLNFNRCVNLLAAIDLATALVAARRFRRVLVITTDRMFDESGRMAGYALFSDGAASCVLSADPGPGGFQVVGCASAQRTAELEQHNEISSELAREVNDALLTPLGMKPGDVAGLMHTNIFLPLLIMKEAQAGFAREQLYPDNVTRVGHCFAADPLINLVDRAAAGHLRPDEHYLLASSVPGVRMGALLRTLAD